MLPQQIATADFLDILFEEKNKLYGAYLLRKEYSKRLFIAVFTMIGIVGILVTAYYLNGQGPQLRINSNVPGDHTLVELPPAEKPQPPVVPPPPPPPQKIASVIFTTPPRILKDKDVRPEDQPPPVEELDRKIIALVNQQGEDAPDITAPPIADTRGIIAAPTRNEDPEDKIFRSVEIESTYPGGMNAWKRYLLKTFRYPSAAQENNIQGQVTVRFIVDKEGKVSAVEAVSGPQELRDEAVRVINASGRWSPAIQNGAMVKSYKIQAITFQLNTE